MLKENTNYHELSMNGCAQQLYEQLHGNYMLKEKRFWKILSRRRPINKKRKNMKKQYMKPAMRVVKMQQRHIICTSPGGYNGQSMKMYNDAIDDENAVW